MADDDRYKWLDEEAAERLLRGPVVNAHDSLRTGRSDVPDRNGTHGAPYEHAADAARPAASTPSWARSGEAVGEERLADLLATLVEEQTALPAAHGAAGAAGVAGHEAELPGEAAALEAFRAARLHGGAAGAAVAAAASEGHDGHVLTGRRRAREKRGFLGGWGLARPLRAGFAMAVAGVAIGGVAVAAGTGVIPVPFGGDRTPAASVSPMVSPGTDDEQTSAGGTGSPSHSDSTRPGSHGGGTSSGSSDDDLAGSVRGQGDGVGQPDGKELSEHEKRVLARELCGKYEDGELPADTREKLEDVAGGAKHVKKFCDGHDGDARADGGPDGGDKPGRPGGAESGGTEGGDDGGGEGEGTEGGDDGGGGEPGGGGNRPDAGDGGTTTDPAGTPTPSPTDPSTTSATESAEATADDTAPPSTDETLTPSR